MRSLLPFFLGALLAMACSSKESPRAAPSAATASPSAAPPSPPPAPPTPSEEVTFDTEDKVPLAGTLYLASAADPAAPLLVLVHRYRGDRSEWAPVTKRLASSEKRYSILTFDLRGHGASRTGPGKKRLEWADMKPKDMPTFVKDVHAAIKYGLSRSAKADRVVLVGSSLGGAFAARAASQDARVIAVGLISPGAAIEGYDVYHPFADVRMLPSFLAGAKEDNVSKEPLDGMSRMAKDLGTVKSYDGKGHGIAGLLAEGDQVTKDLEQWLMGVFEAQPISRELASREGESGKKKPHKGPVP